MDIKNHQMRDDISYMALAGLGKERNYIEFDQRGLSETILTTVCRFYGQDKVSVLGKRRDKHLCMCRHIVTYLVRKYTNMSYKEIGILLGGKDHTTMINSVNVLKGWMETDEELVKQVNAIRTML